MRFLSFLILFCSVNLNLWAQEKVFFETLPVPEGVQVSQHESIPKISWYRWTTKNFTIHSIDKNQGEYLFHNIELMKHWCLYRWGFQDLDFSAESRIFCTPDTQTMKRLFNLEHSAAEIREDADGKIKISYLWIILDGKPAEVIPPALTIVILKELEKKNNKVYPWWIYRGMPVLNSTISQIKKTITYVGPSLEKDSKIFLSKSLLDLTEAEWNKLESDKKQLFDSESALLCLLIRKEFGQVKMHQVLSSNNVQDILGFHDYAALDATYVRYMSHLIKDIKSNITPDSYLQITIAKK